MDNSDTTGPLILVIELGRDHVRAALLGTLPHSVRAALRDAEVRETSSEPEATEEGWTLLTQRERLVAQLVRQALTNQQIASRLRVSPHTVNYHLRQIYRKLGINSRMQLARMALERPADGVEPLRR